MPKLLLRRKPNADKLRLSEDQYFIYIQVFTKMAMTIHKANLRFHGNEPRPQVMNLKVPNLPPGSQHNPPDSQGGRNLNYNPPMRVSQGRAINHAAKVGMTSEYTGEISLRLEIQETEIPYYLAIPCTTTQTLTQSALQAAQMNPWWKFW